MNAAVVHAFDQPPRYSTFADPVPSEGEKLVTVTATGLHQIVKALANGTHYGSTGELPFIPGVDGVGRLEDGKRVFFGIARSPYGTFSDLSLASSWMSIELPDGLDDVTAAGIANPAMSSWVALAMRTKFTAGESVLVLGATGVAGQLAVQIAKRLGARRVVAAGRNPKVLEELRTLGADEVVGLEQEHDALVADFRDEVNQFPVDVVLDYLWGPPAEALLAALTHKGLQKATRRLRFVQIGAIAGPVISLPAATLRSSAIELLGSGFGSASLDQIVKAVSEFFQMAATQPFHFKTKTVPLKDVESFWNVPESGIRLVFQP
jgi:NADPH:quinone reductase-like Zn-dependent oxidoreductase